MLYGYIALVISLLGVIHSSDVQHRPAQCPKNFNEEIRIGLDGGYKIVQLDFTRVKSYKCFYVSLTKPNRAFFKTDLSRNAAVRPTWKGFFEDKDKLYVVLPVINESKTCPEGSTFVDFTPIDKKDYAVCSFLDAETGVIVDKDDVQLTHLGRRVAEFS
ncbi:hypothetical protein HELRODRAFT_179192 [Helobdella robusta]|uniref:Uncharacterized protein n=1 Tax=Helobdella robusta TaxID=6412 RepID=T1FEC1_HELRO|nr:hypothetical protein HELRODRAFT_179192 [Helobdella robusta]ESN95715.1 hypothetical protein HELRODRAFT_179192 [Helobdella robusta]